jgi:hypothetical protein
MQMAWFRDKNIYCYFVFLFTILTGCTKEKVTDNQTKNSPGIDKVAQDSITPYPSPRGILVHDSSAQSRKMPDSIPLKYVLEPPGTTYVDIDGDGNGDIRITDSLWLYFDPMDPHKYWIFHLTTIKSLNIKIQISPGRTTGPVQYFLSKDSVINSSLSWFQKYVCNGEEYSNPEGLFSEYVGLKKVENSHTYYGWLHKPGIYGSSGDVISEFAIDTSAITGRKIFAGRKKK